MKRKIFISYSHNNIDKVELIVNELKKHSILEALVIASNREAGKLLSEKVKTGIKDAQIILPIITEESINEQWINQEIGYATALNKKIMPIVQGDLIDKLKGFIHKQADIPYKFEKSYTVVPMAMKSINKKRESENFMTCFKLLLNDIEKDLKVTSTSSPILYGKRKSHNSW